MSERVYLDWNATAPLRPEARAAMVAAMDVVGNPSSVHAEGRAAKALVEQARAQVSDLVGCTPAEVVFTSGATEAAALAASASRDGGLVAQDTEHDCVAAWTTRRAPSLLGRDGQVDPAALERWLDMFEAGTPKGDVPYGPDTLALSAANSETGICHDVIEEFKCHYLTHGTRYFRTICDLVQRLGKMPVTPEKVPPSFRLASAHKLGGPKGVGALIVREGIDIGPRLRGGGQEMGRRSGTENVIGIAGFGAAAASAKRDLEAGVWAQVEKLRDMFEDMVASALPDTIFVGKDAARLPNTSCVIAPGWKGETQVMQMDLAGFAISAGSACSSGKVKESRVLRAMGFDAIEAASAIRVSLGPTTTQDEITGFAHTWIKAHRRWKEKAA